MDYAYQTKPLIQKPLINEKFYILIEMGVGVGVTGC